MPWFRVQTFALQTTRRCCRQECQEPTPATTITEADDGPGSCPLTRPTYDESGSRFLKIESNNPTPERQDQNHCCY